MSIASPFRLPRTGTVLANRTVLAAMTNKQSAEDGTLSDAEIRWLVRRATEVAARKARPASHHMMSDKCQ